MTAQQTNVNPLFQNLASSLYQSARVKQEIFSKLKTPTYQQREMASLPRKILEMVLEKMDQSLSDDERNLLLNYLKDLGSDIESVKQHSKVTLTDNKLHRMVSHVFEGETRIKINNSLLVIVMGDLIQMPVEAIVSPDSTKMYMERGAPSIIRLWGGEKIHEEVAKITDITLGSVAVTEAGFLPYKYILHAAIMEPHKETTRDNIKAAIKEVFKKIDELKIKTFALPAFGTATVRFPYDICARVMLETIIQNIQKRAGSIPEKTIIALYNQEAYRSFIKQFDLFNEVYQFVVEKDM